MSLTDRPYREVAALNSALDHKPKLRAAYLTIKPAN